MLFDKRTQMKPVEYDFQKYVDAIRNSFRTHTHYSYTSDIQDYNVNMSDSEREVAKRCMLAISQIEVALKVFWSDLHHYIPKPEVASVGATFGFNEVVHADFYSHLLELLGLNEEFKDVIEIPCIKKRIENIQSGLNLQSGGIENFIDRLSFFTLFIENVSLFSQFLIMMSFKTKNNMLKGMYNGILASTKEEDIHATFGTELINIIKEEYPETKINLGKETVQAVIESELEIIDWIFENGELSRLPKDDVKEYVKYRMDKGLKGIGLDYGFEFSQEAIDRLHWFEDTLTTTTHVDFFDLKSPNYSKNLQTFDENDLF